MNERLFKVLGKDGEPFHGGSGKWSLPANGEPGDWMPPIKGDLVPCANGYHLCREKDLLRWLGPTIWAAEYRGERIDDDEKIVVREARLIYQYANWNERTSCLFACDCAERVVHLCGDDERPRKAIEVARRYASGKATNEELTAAWAAARDAARAAAWDAARAAARATAWDAARAAEQEWQTARLLEFLDSAA